MPQFGQKTSPGSTLLPHEGHAAGAPAGAGEADGNGTGRGPVNGRGGGGGVLATGASCTPQFWQNISPGMFW